MTIDPAQAGRITTVVTICACIAAGFFWRGLCALHDAIQAAERERAEEEATEPECGDALDEMEQWIG